MSEQIGKEQTGVDPTMFQIPGGDVDFGFEGRLLLGEVESPIEPGKRKNVRSLAANAFRGPGGKMDRDTFRAGQEAGVIPEGADPGVWRKTGVVVDLNKPFKAHPDVEAALEEAAKDSGE